MLISRKPIPISKEFIGNLHFDSLGNMEITQKKELEENLTKALIIGNTNHAKVQIVFEANGVSHVVETTIWGITDKYIILKTNTVIPKTSIREVIFV